MTTLDMTPTWEEAVTIYIEVLRNPDAPFSAVQAAKEEINAHDETRSSTTAALLPRDLVSETVLSTSRLQKMDEDFIHFLFETPPSGL